MNPMLDVTSVAVHLLISGKGTRNKVLRRECSPSAQVSKRTPAPVRIQPSVFHGDEKFYTAGCAVNVDFLEAPLSGASLPLCAVFSWRGAGVIA